MNVADNNNATAAKRKRIGGGRAFHSRLEAFAPFIREQRKQGRAWKEIAILLATQKGCAITAQGVHQFYRRYVQRRAKGHWEDESTRLDSQPASSVATSQPTASTRKPILAITPTPHEVRRPNLEDLTLNDPTKV